MSGGMEQYDKISSNTVLKIGQKLNGGSYFVEVFKVINEDLLRSSKQIK
jgi:hypothetical protein